MPCIWVRRWAGAVLVLALGGLATTAPARAQPPAASRYASPSAVEAASRAAWEAGDRSTARRLFAIAAAYTELGRPYRYGGDGRRSVGIDCSSLVRYAYARAGLALPRTAREQARVGWPVARSLASLEDGDLVFFALPGGGVSHVGIAMGGSLFIHATSSGHQVTVSSLREPRWQRLWVAARRVAAGESGPVAAAAPRAVASGSDAPLVTPVPSHPAPRE